MAAYSSEAYDFSLFETDGSAARAAAAPILPEQPESPKSSVKAVPQKKEAQLRPAVKALVAVFLSVLVVAGCGILLNRRAKIDSLAAEIRDMKENISLEESDNVRLSRELDKLFAAEGTAAFPEPPAAVLEISGSAAVSEVKLLEGKGHVVGRNRKYACMYLPYHFMGTETPASIILGDFMGVGSHPECRQVSVMAGVANRDIPAGTVLEVKGHHHSIDGLVPELWEKSEAAEIAPFYLLNGLTLKKDIKKGEPVTKDAVDLGDSVPVELYEEGFKL